MPRGPLGERIPFEGVLNCWNDDHDLPDLLLAISRSGKTGRLHFSNPEGDKTLQLKRGRIAFAESSSQDDGLGQYLLRTGKISLMDYTRVSRMVQPGKRLGALLVSENVLSANELVPAVVGQVRAVILGLFRRTETWYRFKEEPLDHTESITLDLSVPELILQGVRYVESWRRISKGVGNLESVYRRATPYEKEWSATNLSEGVRELIDMLAEPTSLTEICERATLPDFEACRYLWAFRSLRWIDVVEAASRVTVDSSSSGVQPPVPSPAAASAQPSLPPEPAPVPASLVETEATMETPAREEATPPPEKASPRPTAIPESLIETQVAMTPPERFDDTPKEPPTPAAPKPIPDDLSQTQVALDTGEADTVESSSETPPTPPSIPGDLDQTQLAVDSPPPAPSRESKPIPDELQHTQMYVDSSDAGRAPETAPPADDARNRSTGELMESILDGDDQPAPRANPSRAQPPAPPPAPSTPPPAPTDASTQLFQGARALEPSGPTTAPTDAPSPQPPPPAQPTPKSDPAPAPSGFEALALGDELDVSTAPPRTPAPPMATPQPNPADLVTQPSVEQPSPPDNHMASFSDLALADAPTATATPSEVEPLPMVEADDVAPEPERYIPDEPLLPQSRNAMEISKESLVPPRRRTDDVDPDSDGLSHVLGNDD